MNNCIICLNDYDDFIECNQCKNKICLACYTKITKCCFCRWGFDTPTYKLAMKKMDQHFDNITNLLRTVEASLRRIRLMEGIRDE